MNTINTFENHTEDDISEAIAALKSGQLTLLKGDIGYGLLGTSEAAIRKMYRIKKRAHTNPCIVIGNLTILQDIALIMSPEIYQWIKEMLTWTTLAVVLPVNPNSECLKRLPPFVYQQTVTHSTIAAFLNIGDYLEQVIAQAYADKCIIVGSSANLSSQGNIYRFNKLPEEIVHAVDFYCDHGACKYENTEKQATTIVNFTNWTIKRRGVNWQPIEESFYQLRNNLKENVKYGD